MVRRILWEIDWLTKMAFKKTLGRAHINLITLQTVVSEVEAMLNDRPLTHISDDITDPKPLTPAHLLHGQRHIRFPHGRASIEDIRDLSYREANQLHEERYQGIFSCAWPLYQPMEAWVFNFLVCKFLCWFATTAVVWGTFGNHSFVLCRRKPIFGAWNPAQMMLQQQSC